MQLRPLSIHLQLLVGLRFLLPPLFLPHVSTTRILLPLVCLLKNKLLRNVFIPQRLLLRVTQRLVGVEVLNIAIAHVCML